MILRFFANLKKKHPYKVFNSKLPYKTPISSIWNQLPFCSNIKGKFYCLLILSVSCLYCVSFQRISLKALWEKICWWEKSFINIMSRLPAAITFLHRTRKKLNRRKEIRQAQCKLLNSRIIRSVVNFSIQSLLNFHVARFTTSVYRGWSRNR